MANLALFLTIFFLIVVIVMLGLAVGFLPRKVMNLYFEFRAMREAQKQMEAKTKLLEQQVLNEQLYGLDRTKIKEGK